MRRPPWSEGRPRGVFGYAQQMATTAKGAEKWPGQDLGLPASGRGSLASWTSRITAIVLDWALSMLLAWIFFGSEAIRGSDWRAFTILGLFYLQTSLLTALTGGSVGKLITRIGVTRVDGQPISILQTFARQFMVCLVIPALVIGVNRRGLDDLVLGTVVVNRR